MIVALDSGPPAGSRRRWGAPPSGWLRRWPVPPMPTRTPLPVFARTVGLVAELHGLPLQPLAEPGDAGDGRRRTRACQWFNAQYDTLSAQAFGFQNALHDSYRRVGVGVQGAGDALRANLDQSAAFLDPRVHTLYITNYPDQSQYSPLYNGDSFYHLWYQLTQISDKIARQMPSGRDQRQHRHDEGLRDAIRNSGVCNGA